jgi:hypothetical protein
MHKPKAATDNSNLSPVFVSGGFIDNANRKVAAPNDGAALSQPNSRLPTCRISLANTGNNATAPPNNTAKRSRHIADKMILF